MAPRITDLKKMSDEDLVKQHDMAASSTMVGISYYLDELRSRENDKVTKRMAVLADRMWGLTLIMFILTIVSTVFTVLAYYR